MSVPVALEDLRAEAACFGSAAYLLTVGADGRPRANAVAPVWEADRFVFGAGDGTRGTVAARPAVALLWPPPEPGGLSLIVDGTADVDGTRVIVTPERAVLHRARR